ncbi:putative protein TPRXL [Anopheles moucheti]|uniref:putative protein TPRXL n=1 Tax=Anopheles moucheti TaxID=186751 RepID=UPI0022F0CE88|nr:putative protein TPRXL [Anopheles moucheti]
MMQAALVYVCFGALLAVWGGNGMTHQQNEPPDVNVTVTNVISALSGYGKMNFTGHHFDRGQRIVARKGVSNDVATVAKGAVADQLTSAGANAAAPSNSTAGSSSSSSVPATQTNVTTTTTMASSATNGSTIPTISANASSTTASSAKPSSPPQSKRPGSSTNATTTQHTSATSSSNTTRSTTTIITTIITTTTTTTTASTTTTTSTTTKPPKKPKITYSIEDEPKLLQAAKPGYGAPYDPVDSSGRLRIDEPLAQFSQEYLPSGFGGGAVGGPGEPPNTRREYIVPIVTLIFAIPLLLGLFLLSYRRAKEFWLTRHYRRMDFLIDGMYNY